jgi:hypothetical protein
MNVTHVTLRMISKAAALAGIAAISAFPIAVAADQPPSYAIGPDASAQTIKGTIFAITGKYTLTLQDERGFEDSVTLHNGTLITPTGLQLGSGQVAQIIGHPDGKTFDADEIDVDPGSISSGQPLLPAGDYSALSGGGYPGYAFGIDSGYYNPYGYGYYGGLAPAYYNGYGGGYYGGGNVYYVNPQPVQAQPPTSATGGPTVRRPVPIGGGQYTAPGLRYPTGGTVHPISRPAPPTFRAPQVQTHPAPPPTATRLR